MQAFLKSVLFGVIAGTVSGALMFVGVWLIGIILHPQFDVLIFLPVTLPLEVIFVLLTGGLYSFVVSIPLVLGASICIGLPLAAFLKRMGRESEIAYIAAGILAGFSLPVAILLLVSFSDNCWTAIPGAISGAVTGRSWWAYGRRPCIGS